MSGDETSWRRPAWADEHRGPWDDFDVDNWMELAVNLFAMSSRLSPPVQAWVDRRRPPDDHYSPGDADVIDLLEATGPWPPEADALESDLALLAHIERQIGQLCRVVSLMMMPPAGSA